MQYTKVNKYIKMAYFSVRRWEMFEFIFRYLSFLPSPSYPIKPLLSPSFYHLNKYWHSPLHLQLPPSSTADTEITLLLASSTSLYLLNMLCKKIFFKLCGSCPEMMSRRNIWDIYLVISFVLSKLSDFVNAFLFSLWIKSW